MYFYNSMLSTAHVSEIETLSPKLRRIRISGRSLQMVSWHPGDKIKIMAGPKLRSYTPARINTEEGWMDIIFFLHGNGHASDWAQHATVGIDAYFIGPVRSMPTFEKTPDWVVFLGDETTIGLAVGLLESLPPHVKIHGAIELAAADIPSLDQLALSLAPAIRTEYYGEALHNWLDDFSPPQGNGVVWLSGEVSSVRSLKGTLLNRGFSRTQLKIKPYWSVRGHAHRKALQRDL